MSLLKEAAEEIRRKIECKPLSEDAENWYKCLAAMDRNTYVPLQYKPGFLKYQEAYFKDVYDPVLHGGIRPAGPAVPVPPAGGRAAVGDRKLPGRPAGDPGDG